METIFTTEAFKPEKRGAAWIDALCGNYVTVEAKLRDFDAYSGYLKVAEFGQVGVSETCGSPQVVSRQAQHLRNVEKDCYYLQYLEQGQIGLAQHGTELLTDRTMMGLYSASEAYSLDCMGTTTGRFLEIPRAALVTELDGDDLPLTRGISGKSGMGRVLLEFMRSLYDEASSFDSQTRAKLGLELISLTALAVRTTHPCEAEGRPTLRNARLNSIKRYLDANLKNPTLDVRQIARDNEISVRYLHRLFSHEDTSVSHWLWQRRLESSFTALKNAAPNTRIIEVAFDHGFNSSSHFSTAFKARFGMSPSDVLGQSQKPS